MQVAQPEMNWISSRRIGDVLASLFCYPVLLIPSGIVLVQYQDIMWAIVPEMHGI